LILGIIPERPGFAGAYPKHERTNLKEPGVMTITKSNPSIAAAAKTLARIEQLVDSTGGRETPQTAAEIGKMMVELATDPAFNPEDGEYATEARTPRWHFAYNPKTGRSLSTYTLGPIKDSPADSVHYHGNWEVVTMVKGNWIDAFYKPITDDPYNPGIKQVEFDNNPAIKVGEFLAHPPGVPHGFRKGDSRDVDGINLVYHGQNFPGQHRMDLDPKTGQATAAAPIPGSLKH
jgi:hypothetical protein